MGHLNFRELHQASKNSIIRGAYTGSDGSKPSYEIYLQRKINRLSFPKASNRKSQMLVLIHIDICGLMRVQPNGGSKYFITFTDNCSRWTEMRFIAHKSQALEEFKAYKIFVEQQHGMKIKALQSDMGASM